MLESLLGSTSRERVLMFILARDRGYGAEISQFYDVDLAPLQKQLERLEAGGVLVSQPVGRTRVYSFNPRYPFRTELQALLAKALTFYPADVRAALVVNRRRPRRTGKPL
ncbi:MAG: winged helix-turn-helix domain-containing protein [Gammaproteobacteria bacterium]|jgi:predicted transcriptional regulator|nr:winged helix-turn-helix domain-containing protein [Gammaproteobacteria bacterium]